MDTSTEQDEDNSLKFIRKLRKKLRQVERLEKIQRELTDEEKIKLSCKHDIRSKLQLILSTINEANVSLESNHSEQDGNEANKLQDEALLEKSSHDSAVKITGLKELPPSSSNLQTNDTLNDMSALETRVAKEEKVEKSKKVQNIRSTLRRYWRNSTFYAYQLEGHNEAINCLDAIDDWIVSGSRDTTLKLWDAKNGNAIRSMGGHTAQITAVVILQSDASDSLRQNIDPSTVEVFADIDEKLDKDEKVVISGSTDCSIRLWLIPQGVFVKSLYNYNPVSALAFYGKKNYVIAGSTGGNLTVYNLCSNSQVYSCTIHKNQITKIQCQDGRIITSSADGSIKVWKIEQKQACGKQSKVDKYGDLQFSVSSEDFDISLVSSLDENSSYIPDRHIHCFTVCGDTIYYGDDGTNVKVWNLNSGELSKMRNHKPNVPGITDDLCVKDDLLFSTSYDLDSGIGSLNVRSLHPNCYGAYISSFSCDEITRLACFIMQFSSERKYLVTGGEKLLLWRFFQPGDPRDVDKHEQFVAMQGQNVPELTKPPADSDVSSEDEASSDEEEGKWFWQWSKAKPEKSPGKNTRRRSRGSEDSETSYSSKDESSLNNSSSYSLWDWCNIL